MARSAQVTFAGAGPARRAAFWASALDYILQSPPDGYASRPAFLRDAGVPEERWSDVFAIVDSAGAGPRIFFQRGPEPKVLKNRVHLDVNVGAGRETALEERRANVRARSGDPAGSRRA